MDELEQQLKQYANAAEQRVPVTPEAALRRRSWRPLFAAAAAIALIGGPLGVFVATRGSGERVETVPADTTTTPFVLPRHQCPSPAVTPNLEHLQIALPMVARSEHTFGPDNAGNDVQTVVIAPNTDHWVEVRIEAVAPAPDLVEPPVDAATLPVIVCDPFHHDGPVPRTVLAVRFDDGGGRALSFPLGSNWTASVRTGTRDRSTITDDLLLEIIAGMSWPAPTASGGEETGATTTSIPADDAACDTDPEVAIEVGSFTVTAVPDGFEPMLPVEVVDSGVQVDPGGTSTATLSLVQPDGRSIQVTAFGAASPREYIADALGVGEYEPINVRRCTRTANGWERLDGLASIGTNGGRMMLAAQEWEYEGYLVIGSPGVDREQIVTVAAGLRFGSVP